MTAGVPVLVVDDEPNIVDMVATVLRFHGFEVDTAGTAAEALRRAAERPPSRWCLTCCSPRRRLRGGRANRWRPGRRARASTATPPVPVA